MLLEVGITLCFTDNRHYKPIGLSCAYPPVQQGKKAMRRMKLCRSFPADADCTGQPLCGMRSSLHVPPQMNLGVMHRKHRWCYAFISVVPFGSRLCLFHLLKFSNKAGILASNYLQDRNTVNAPHL